MCFFVLHFKKKHVESRLTENLKNLPVSHAYLSHCILDYFDV